MVPIWWLYGAYILLTLCIHWMLPDLVDAVDIGQYTEVGESPRSERK
jgi:hypothetical protein